MDALRQLKLLGDQLVDRRHSRPRRNPGDRIAVELWLTNGTAQPLTRLRAQICVMLARARGFDAQTNDNKKLTKPTASVRSGEQWISTTWENTARVWGNANCPCMHADPALADCAPGETVRVVGSLSFGRG